MKIYICTLLVFLAAAALAVDPAGLATLRDTYQDQLSKIADEEMATTATAQEQYIAALAALEKHFQSAGKLDPLLKAQNEKKRFSEERKVGAGDIVLDVPEISTLQNKYIGAIKNLPLAPAQKRLTLAGFYERSLRKLEEDLTKQDDIQGALAVKAEREGLATRSEVVLSQKTVASLSKPAPMPEPDRVEVVKDVPVVEEVRKPSALSMTEKSRIEGTIKRLFNDFVDDVEDQDWDDALAFVDPTYVKKTGTQVAKSVLKMKFGMVARGVADNPRAKIKVKDIEVDDTGERATLTPELWTGIKGHTLPSINYVPVDGEWYVSLGNANDPGGADKWERPNKRRKPRR